MILAGYVKTKKQVLLVQSLQIALLTISNFVLGGITGAIVNLISIIRNILSYKNKLNRPILIAIIIATTILPLIALLPDITNIQKLLVGILPIIATVAYTININTKDIIKLKYTLIFSMIIWCIFDICILSISALFDLFTIIAAIISIIQIKRKQMEK